MSDPRFAAFEEKMKAKGCSEAAINAFRKNYAQLVVENFTGLVRSSTFTVLKGVDVKVLDRCHQRSTIFDRSKNLEGHCLT